MEKITELLRQIDDAVWGPYMLFLMVGAGCYLMVRMRFLPIRRLGYALGCAVGREKDIRVAKEGEISPFSALMTELAATIGTGNIVGVATAMVLGGPGALVWMILSSLAGLSTKFAESMLSVTFRTRNDVGETVGGPMYTLKNAFPYPAVGKILGILFAVSAVAASLGMGNMTQSNSIASALKETFQVSPVSSGLLITVATILAVAGGIRSISRATRVIVPVMAVFYMAGAFVVIGANYRNLPAGIAMILTMAFSRQAVAGGVGGHLVASVSQAARWGIARGVFSNEAGLGAAGISAAAAHTNDPVRQGYISMTGVFLDTVILCSVTGLTLASSGVLGLVDGQGNLVTGTGLTIAAFEGTFGRAGAVMVSIGIVLFAFATIIGWAYQGEKAFEFLTGRSRYNMCYRILYGVTAFVGAVCSLEAVWNFSDIMNGLMALPNLICVLVLAEIPCRAIREYDHTVSGRRQIICHKDSLDKGESMRQKKGNHSKQTGEK